MKKSLVKVCRYKKDTYICQTITLKQRIMTTLKNTPENNAKVSALRTIKETQWVGNVTHDKLDKCLTAINLFQGFNSGFYTPKAIRLNGVQGIFMINEDGGLNFESRVIKISDNVFRIEYMTNEAYNSFESKYLEILT